MGKKILGSIAAVLLVSLAAVGAFASQDGVQTQGEPTVTDTETATPTEESTATPTEESTATPTSTAEPDATDTPEATATPGDDDDEDDTHGIPDSNPSKQPNDDDVCEKGETEIKTTPSGNRVNVPCHVADKGEHEQNKNKHDADDGDDEDDQEAEDEDEDE